MASHWINSTRDLSDWVEDRAVNWMTGEASHDTHIITTLVMNYRLRIERNGLSLPMESTELDALMTDDEFDRISGEAADGDQSA